MRPLMLVALLAACSDPTKVAATPTIGAIAGTIIRRSNSSPVPGVYVTMTSTANATYSARDTTDSPGMFIQNDVPVGVGQFQLRHLPTGCDSLLVAPFAVNGGQIDTTTVVLTCA